MIWLLMVTLLGALMPIRGPKGCDEGDMIPQLKRHEIQVLLDAGFTPTDVAKRSGTSLDTVRRVRNEAPVTDTDDAVHRKEHRVGRPSKAAPFTVRVATWLAKEPAT